MNECDLKREGEKGNDSISLIMSRLQSRKERKKERSLWMCPQMTSLHILYSNDFFSLIGLSFAKSCRKPKSTVMATVDSTPTGKSHFEMTYVIHLLVNTRGTHKRVFPSQS